MNKQGKSFEYIQSFLNSNFSIIYQTLPDEVKKDKDLVYPFVERLILC